MPRIVFEQLSPQLGQPIVVENRTGAGGTLGTSAVAKADPDGYTLLAHSNAFSVAPAIYASLPYDTEKDFAAIIPFGSLPAVLVMSPSKGFKTIQEMVAAAKAKPGTFNYASVGVGSGTHLSAEKLKLGAGFDAVHIPFRGGPEALTEIIAGRVDFYFCPINTALPLDPRRPARCAGDERRRAGARIARGADHARGRLPECRFSDLDRDAGAGQTPRPIIDRLNAETIKAIQVPGDAGAARQGRHRAADHDAGGVRRAHQGGNRRPTSPSPRPRASSPN